MKMISIYFFISLLHLMNSGCDKSEGPKPDPDPIDDLEVNVDFDKNYSFLESGSFVQDRNFYLLTLMQELSNVQVILERDTVLNSFKNRYLSRVLDLADDQNSTMAQIASELKISDSEMNEVTTYLGDLTELSEDLKFMIKMHAKPSGVFLKFQAVSSSRMVELGWIAICEGFNNIIEEYVLGEEPRDIVSDGPAYDVNSEEYRQLVMDIIINMWEDKEDFSLFFEPALCFSLELLNINNRNEAGKFEPLKESENKAAIDYIPTIDWDEYSYASILLLGDSPNSAGDDVRISESAKDRVKLAADRYHDQKAALIIISGANMYPFQTPYFEAIEMKKWMMAHYSVPEEAILVDPHGRHTTTNLRNGSRYIFRYGIPVDKKSIVTAIESHIDYVASNNFYNTCNKHFGFMPVELKDRISINDIEFIPRVISLHADAIDPLDP
jgi:hypothetical protein